RRPSWRSRTSQSFLSLAHDTAMSPLAGRGSSSPRNVQVSAIKPVALSSGIENVLERLGAEPPIGLEERLVLAGAKPEVRVDDLLDGVRHLLGRESGAQDLPDRRALGGGAAERDLVIFLALLVEAED